MSSISDLLRSELKLIDESPAETLIQLLQGARERGYLTPEEFLCRPTPYISRMPHQDTSK